MRTWWSRTGSSIGLSFLYFLFDWLLWEDLRPQFWLFSICFQSQGTDTSGMQEDKYLSAACLGKEKWVSGRKRLQSRPYRQNMVHCFTVDLSYSRAGKKSLFGTFGFLVITRLWSLWKLPPLNDIAFSSGDNVRFGWMPMKWKVCSMIPFDMRSLDWNKKWKRIRRITINYGGILKWYSTIFMLLVLSLYVCVLLYLWIKVTLVQMDCWWRPKRKNEKSPQWILA